jgi:hypothetical protein
VVLRTGKTYRPATSACRSPLVRDSRTLRILVDEDADVLSVASFAGRMRRRELRGQRVMDWPRGPGTSHDASYGPTVKRSNEEPRTRQPGSEPWTSGTVLEHRPMGIYTVLGP